jgi:hypothetical protein
MEKQLILFTDFGRVSLIADGVFPTSVNPEHLPYAPKPLSVYSCFANIAFYDIMKHEGKIMLICKNRFWYVTSKELFVQ